MHRYNFIHDLETGKSYAIAQDDGDWVRYKVAAAHIAELEAQLAAKDEELRLNDEAWEIHHKDCCEELGDLQKQLAAERERNRWIPVTERLPEKGGDYLVLINGYVNIRRWITVESRWWENGSCDGGFIDNITHWRELPLKPED